MRRAIGAVAFATVLLAAAATPALANPGDPGSGPPAADHNGDCRTDISDAVIVLMHAFQSEPLVTVTCGDCNDDSEPDISDPIFMLNHMFLGGPPAGHPPNMIIEASCSDLGP